MEQVEDMRINQLILAWPARRLVFMLMMSISPMASSYMVENNTGREEKFYGQFCAACWHGLIPDGEARGCPGDAHGCKGTTFIYLWAGQTHELNNCYWTSDVPVTAHGRIVFNSDTIQVYNDQGQRIFSTPGSYYYTNPRDFWILTKTNDCPRRF